MPAVVAPNCVGGLVRQAHTAGPGPSERRIDLGQPEIQHLGVTAPGQEDVGRLDVAMDDALGMRRVQRIRHLDAHPEKRAHLHPAARDRLLQRLALQQFHRQVRPPLVVADFVDCADIRMIQRGRRPRLAAKPHQRIRILHQVIGQELDGGESLELHVPRPVHHAHSAAAKLLQHLVVGDRSANEGIGVGHTSLRPAV